MIFTRLREHGFLYAETQQQWYSPAEKRFLPDRYVEGTCYLCGYDSARGDQCDKCGQLLDAPLLIDPHSKTGNRALELRSTEHQFLDLAKLAPQVAAFLANSKEHWRANVIKPVLHTVNEDGLHGRAITRDLDWGIPVPLPNWGGKCLYVWFEAVIGYLPPPLSGRTTMARQQPGTTGGTKQTPAHTISSARTTFRFMR